MEMDRAMQNALCCRGGGGNFFTDMLGTGPDLAARARIREALATGADTLAVACPQCYRMLADAVKDEAPRSGFGSGSCRTSWPRPLRLAHALERMMFFITAGAALGLSAGFSPGPLLTLVLTETLHHGVKAGIRVALAPMITDAPIIVLTLLFCQS